MAEFDFLALDQSVNAAPPVFFSLTHDIVDIEEPCSRRVMKAKIRDSTIGMRPALRRWLGVLACLLALAMVLFGHVEGPEAAPLNATSAAVTLDHGGGPAGHGKTEGPQHCVHHAQCSFFAVLPSIVPGGFFGAKRVDPSIERVRDSQTISPHRPPPKSLLPA